MKKDDLEHFMGLKRPMVNKGKPYIIIMSSLTILGLLPLCFIHVPHAIRIIELIAAIAFIIDYFLRWIVADRVMKKCNHPYLLYPFSFNAVIDLVSIIPLFAELDPRLELLKLFRILYLARLVKALRLSSGFMLIGKVIHREREGLLLCLGITVSYILITALVVFNIEPETFKDFFNAIYWAAGSLMTNGNSQLVPTSIVGKIFSMISSLLGVAMIALPSGLITAGFFQELSLQKK